MMCTCTAWLIPIANYLQELTHFSGEHFPTTTAAKMKITTTAKAIVLTTTRRITSMKNNSCKNSIRWAGGRTAVW